ncbi:fibrinogen-like YCDxxxxGGGW domain-containing protein [Pseudoalteromonas rubra]|uniref:fibrinogen-like YCDxxxxGGGW domain-containing protein n=1 Tax=Pseudoalteromonas rubra TaxID=43658 RepID=UPI000F767D2E|nr:fibrinogen-like YCDxxxxGGGW domain-containing protein [Pseudoalteromonas rubra]
MLKTPLYLSLLACTSAFAANEYTETSINDAWNTLAHTQGSLVFASAPTDNEADAGVVALQNNNGAMEIAFKEWPYLDGAHGDENMAVLSLPAGRQTLEDGTIIEVGTFALGNGETHISFADKFEHTPHLFLSGQSFNNNTAYATRVHGVTQHGFTALKQGQEKAVNAANKETVAYLAIYAPNNTGTLAGRSFVLDQIKLDHTGGSASDYGLYLQEEQSKDTEITHITEHVNVLNFGQRVFAQDVTAFGRDTIAPRMNSDFAQAPSGQSCAEIKSQYPLAETGYYTITPAGATAIKAYCEMDKETGGWTLFASHNTAVNPIQVADVVGLDTYSVMTDTNWQAVRDTMQYGMMVVDSAGRVGIIEKEALLNGSCISLNQTDSIAYNPAPYGRIWHTENSGCGGSGGDYSEIIINEGWSHAYNFTGVFSKWEFGGGYTAGIVAYYIK